MIEYKDIRYPSPCKKTLNAKVQESGFDSDEKWSKVTEYECGCKVFENFYGGREEKCQDLKIGII
jgi:hypothetical protein